MTAQPAYTLANTIEIAGIGVHTGMENRVRLVPRKRAGVVLQVNGAPLTLSPTHMQPTPLCTMLAEGSARLSTPEHLLSALHGLGVLGLKIEVEGPSELPEVPILDGSALPWVEAIDAAGREALEHAPETLNVRAPCTYTAEGRVLMAAPRFLPFMQVECTVSFPHPLIGMQTWRGVMTEEIFRTEIAPARSFALEGDVKAAMVAGMLKGASLNTGVLFKADGGVANPEGLRFADEPVRHKIADFMGDSFLTGRRVQGDFTLNAPGHSANNALLRKVLAQQEDEA
jgi:UDP-3-O-[3-hydroxymyristoyl] N-acetylglucosamine deacetylase